MIDTAYRLLAFKHVPQSVTCPKPPANRPVGTTGRVGAALRDPLGAIIALDVRGQAIEATASRFGGSGEETDNTNDAYRHFFGSFLLTRLIGAPRASAILNANEVHGGPGADSRMDSYNNSVGVTMAQDPRWSGRSVQDAANASLSNGCLVQHP